MVVTCLKIKLFYVGLIKSTHKSKLINNDFMEAACKCTVQLINKGQEINQQSTL